MPAAAVTLSTTAPSPAHRARRRLRRAAPLFGLLVAAGFALPSAAQAQRCPTAGTNEETVCSIQGDTPGSTFSAGYSGGQLRAVATPFSTGSNAGNYTLTSVRIRFFGVRGTPGDIVVAIHANNGTVPAATATGTLTGSNPTAAGRFDFTGSIALTASTTYWLVVTAPDAPTSGANAYDVAASASGTTNDGWTIRNDTYRRMGTESFERSALNVAIEFGIVASAPPPPGIELETTTLALNEGGNVGGFNLRLATQPSADVVVTPSSSDSDLVMIVDPQTLTFTPDNWNAYQSFQFSTGDDDVDTPEFVRVATLSFATTSTDASYNGLTDQPMFTVEVRDNDTAGMALSTNTVSMTETGTAMYTISVETEPMANVVVTPRITPASGVAMFAPPTLTFTASNWEDAQTITVTAVDDDLINEGGQRTANIVHGVATTDAAYSVNNNALSVAVTVLNDDSAAGVAATPETLSVAEPSGTGSYTLVLDLAPTAAVVVTPSIAPAVATLSPAALTFTTANWETAQSVVVTAVDDALDNAGNQRTGTISHAVTSTDTAYAGLSILPTVSVTVTDDDAPPAVGGCPSRTPGQVGACTIEQTRAETDAVVGHRGSAMGVASFFFPGNLDSTLHSVHIGIAGVVGAPGALTVRLRTGISIGGSTVLATLSGPNPTTAGVYEFTVKGDVTIEGSRRHYLELVAEGAPSSGDNYYRVATTSSEDEEGSAAWSIGNASSAFSGTRNDYAAVATTDYRALAFAVVGDLDLPVIAATPAALTLDESGVVSRGEYALSLDVTPNEDVTITPNIAPAGVARFEPATLTFTSTNWDTPQTVRVIAVDDGVANVGTARSATITHAVTTVDFRYSQLAGSGTLPSVAVTVTERAPEDTSLSALALSDDTGAVMLDPSFDAAVQDYAVELAPGATTLTVSATASDTDGSATISAALGGATQSVTSGTARFTLAGRASPLVITVTNSDEVGNTFTRSYRVELDYGGGHVFTREQLGDASLMALGALEHAGVQLTNGTIAKRFQTPQPFGAASGGGGASLTLAGQRLGDGAQAMATAQAKAREAAEEHALTDFGDAVRTGAALHAATPARMNLPAQSFSFSLPGNYNKYGGANFWGAMGYADLGGNPQVEGRRPLHYDGDVLTLQFGLDRYFGDTLVGLSFGWNEGEADFRQAALASDPEALDGVVRRSGMSIHPYVSRRTSATLNYWAIGGIGIGDFEMGVPAASGDGLLFARSDLQQWMAAGGADARLLEGPNAELSARFAGMWSRSEVDAAHFEESESVPEFAVSLWQAHAELEATRVIQRGEHSLRPYALGALRTYGGDGIDQSAAFDLGGGLKARIPRIGLSYDFGARIQALDYGDEDVSSYYAALRYDMGCDQLGLTASLSHGLANAATSHGACRGAGGTASVAEPVAQSRALSDAQRMRREARVGYGWPARLGTRLGALTAHAALRSADGGAEHSIGLGFVGSGGFTLRLETLQRDEERQTLLRWQTNF